MRCIHPAGPHATCLSDGRTIELTETIGRGSLGEVERGVVEGAWGLRRPVAVKTYDVAPENDPNEVHRQVARIARRAAGVIHPGVVQILEVDQTEAGRPLVVMELVDGESLGTILGSWRDAEVRTPLDFALVVGLRISEALAAGLLAESTEGLPHPLIHGDLSPRQVLISKHGEVKLGDFGQGALRQTVSHVRSRDYLAYTPPEITSGQPADARSDVFALGVILHEMLVGPRFAKGTTTAEAAKMVRDGVVYEPIFGPKPTPELRAVLDGALDPDPKNRYPHARALAFDLRREVLRMGLCDVQTSVRHAIVGYCEVSGTGEIRTVPEDRKSGPVPRSSRPDIEDTFPGHRRARKA